jgi:hypothetical protein
VPQPQGELTGCIPGLAEGVPPSSLGFAFFLADEGAAGLSRAGNNRHLLTGLEEDFALHGGTSITNARRGVCKRVHGGLRHVVSVSSRQAATPSWQIFRARSIGALRPSWLAQ